MTFAEARDVCVSIGRAVADELRVRAPGELCFEAAHALPLVEPWADGNVDAARALAHVVAGAVADRWRVLAQARR